MKLKYQVVFFDLQRKILSGEWPEETMIPTETELCEIHKVSRITVRRALDELVQLGFIYRVRGKGSFVTKSRRLAERRRGVPHSVPPEGAKMLNRIEEDNLYPPGSALAKNFIPLFNGSAKSDEGIARLRMLSYIDDRPYALMSIFMPQNISDLIGREMLSSKTFLEAYEEVVGDKIATIHRSISAVIPDDEQCDLLGAQPGSAHLWMKNIALREDESPVAMNYAIYNGNVYDFAVELELNSPSFF